MRKKFKISILNYLSELLRIIYNQYVLDLFITFYLLIPHNRSRLTRGRQSKEIVRIPRLYKTTCVMILLDVIVFLM